MRVKFHVTVVFKEQKIDYLIDQSLSIETIIKNICLELNKSEIRIQDLSLRNFETEELITDENFRRKVKEGDHLKLVASPAIEAADTVRNMKSFDEGTVKRTIFMLQKYIKVRKKNKYHFFIYLVYLKYSKFFNWSYEINVYI